jgi:hypothetical protein
MVLHTSRIIRHRAAIFSSALCVLTAGLLGTGAGCNAMRGVNGPSDLLASSSVNRPQAVDMAAANRSAPPQFAQPQFPQQQLQQQQQFPQSSGPQSGPAQQPFAQQPFAQQQFPQQQFAQQQFAQQQSNQQLPATQQTPTGLANPGMSPGNGLVSQVSHNAPLPNACQVVLQDADGKTTRRTLPLDKQQHIQDLLVQSGAIKQFSRMDIALLRTTPSGGKQRMNVEFDRSKRAVEMQYDYFIMPGDVLLVTEDSSTIVDDMIKSTGLVRSSSRRTSR